MDKFLLTGWLVVLLAAVCAAEAAHSSEPYYLGYISPFKFLHGDFGPYRQRRSAMGYMGYGHHNAMSYSPSFGFNPMTYPHKMFAFPHMKFPSMPNLPAFPKFPDMKFPAMPDYHPPSYNDFLHPIMPSSNIFNSDGYKPYQPADPAPHHPFGDHFMKMMGFHVPSSHGNNYNNVGHPSHPSNYNNADHPSHPSNYNNVGHPTHPSNNYNNNHNNYNNNYNTPKGNNYEMSYSKSSSMNMDYTNGKGHMMTKDSSYMNDNGKVYQHNGPEKHFVDYGNGKFVPQHGPAGHH